MKTIGIISRFTVKIINDLRLLTSSLLKDKDKRSFNNKTIFQETSREWGNNSSISNLHKVDLKDNNNNTTSHLKTSSSNNSRLDSSSSSSSSIQSMNCQVLSSCNNRWAYARTWSANVRVC